MCDRGNMVGNPYRSRQKGCTVPLEPMRALNPPMGVRLLPVTNWSNRALWSDGDVGVRQKRKNTRKRCDFRQYHIPTAHAWVDTHGKRNAVYT